MVAGVVAVAEVCEGCVRVVLLAVDCVDGDAIDVTEEVEDELNSRILLADVPSDTHRLPDASKRGT